MIFILSGSNKALFSILGKSNLHFAGMSIAVNISVDGLNLMIPTTRQVRMFLGTQFCPCQPASRWPLC